jgi:hypothetical protein
MHDPNRHPASSMPRQVLLFAGHMVDAPGRPVPRFPVGKAPVAGERIAEALDACAAGPDDLAFTQGAAGGDLLFVEACQQRGVPVRLLLPLTLEDFLARSVRPSQDGAAWEQRLRAALARLDAPPLEAPAVLGPLPQGGDVFVRGNEWLLESALAFGAERLHCMCLWDGGGSDGPGGTRHLVEAVRRLGGRITWIDTRAL